MQKIAIVALVAATSVLVVATETPLERKSGLSAHMLPDRVASLKGESGGFDIRPQHEIKSRTVIPNAKELVDYYRSLSEQVQHNGIWIVTTHPLAYSKAEKAELDKLKTLCRNGGIALFISRASELPDGWRQES